MSSNASPKPNENASGNTQQNMDKSVKAEQEAFSTAAAIRSLTVPSAARQAGSTAAADLQKVKEQLLNSKIAETIIKHLARLPSPANIATVPTIENSATSARSQPTHAVTLSMPDEKVDQLLSSKLQASSKAGEQPAGGFISLHHATLSSVQDALKDIKAVSLVGNQGGSGTVAPATSSVSGGQPLLTEVESIGKSLLLFGNAVDDALPNSEDKDVHPPTDKISILTHWWGYEICIPHTSMDYFKKADSVVDTLERILSVTSVIYPPMAIITPITHFVANAIDSEWDSIQAKDQGQGVVCTATWLVPVAIISRCWDFSPAPTPAST